MAAAVGNLHHSDGAEARRRYVTAILVRIDPIAHTFEYVNAGHNPGFLVDASGNATLLESSGPPLGILPRIAYSSTMLELEPGAGMLLYTDGLVEVFQGDEEFGEERLLSEFRDTDRAGAGPVLDRLLALLSDFSQGAPQADDMTALAILRQGGTGKQ